MCPLIHVHSSVCAHSGVKRPAAYLWLVMLWPVVSDSPAFLWPPVIQNMTLSVRPPTWNAQAVPQEFTGQRWDWLKLIFIAPVPGVCAWQWACAFKAAKAWVGKKKKGRKKPKKKPSSPGLSAWLHQCYEILKNICLCLSQGKSAKGVPVHYGVLWRVEGLGGVIPPTTPPPSRCFTGTCLCPDIAHLCTLQRPASLQPSALTHYRSSWQHHKWQISVHLIPPVVYFCTRQSVTCNNTWRVRIDSVCPK